MQQNAAAFYRTQEIMTASPAKLVAMLYDRAIRALRDAVRAIGANDIEARCNNNAKAVGIITHLWGTLDLERGGEIAINLSELYRFMVTRLKDVDLRNDAKAAEEVIGLLLPLAESWRKLSIQAADAAPDAARPQPPAGTLTSPRSFAFSA